MSDLDYVIGLGGNLGDPRLTFGRALRACKAWGSVSAVSRLFDTAPVGPPQPRFLNAALRLSSPLAPEVLLAKLLSFEHQEGRVRDALWGPRTLDLDILWLRDQVWDSPQLILPHPRLCERAFALFPLLEVAPDACDPRTGETYSSIASRLDASGILRLPEGIPC